MDLGRTQRRDEAIALPPELVQHQENLPSTRAEQRTHRWKLLLKGHRCERSTEPTAAEKIDRSYLDRPPRLTLLAPNIVEAIVDGR